MQNTLNNSQKITKEMRHENKANKSGFTILLLFKNSCAINKLSDNKHGIKLKPYKILYKQKNSKNK